MEDQDKSVGSKITAKRVAAKVVSKHGAKVVARVATKQAAKQVARAAASPYLLAADGVEIATEKVACSCGASKSTAKTVSKGAGLAASAGIGAAIGGPFGAAAGAAVWGVGEVLEATGATDAIGDAVGGLGDKVLGLFGSTAKTRRRRR